MTVTHDDVIARFPELADFDEDVTPILIAEAERRTNRAAWGVRADDGVKYLVAHFATLFLRNQAAINGSASLRGPLTFEEIGPLRRSFASLGFASSLTFDMVALSQTPYGAMYFELRTTIFAARQSYVI